ncbi:MAG: mitochondrial fission ELM1 family protein, partial [Alphaproteobacteria bacterium]|nr:mitochondrial fission ELM1 family protein [Alphaproteobacteria bacterium]
MSEYKKTCWVLTEGMAGTEKQCTGLAAALGLDPVVKRVRLRAPWKQFSPWLRWGHRFALDAGSDLVTPPWPDVLIASGRKSIGIALDIKKRSPKTFLVQVQDPRIGAEAFDLVVVPEHDPLRGDNVMVTKGALHGVTPVALEQAGAAWRDKLAHLPSPRVAVLIGGTSRAHQMTLTAAKGLVEDVQRIGGGLMVTASRRTGAENLAFLRDTLKGPDVF